MEGGRKTAVAFMKRKTAKRISAAVNTINAKACAAEHHYNLADEEKAVKCVVLEITRGDGRDGVVRKAPHERRSGVVRPRVAREAVCNCEHRQAINAHTKGNAELLHLPVLD